MYFYLQIEISLFKNAVTKTDAWLLVIVLPYFMTVTLIIFGSRYFQEALVFQVATIISLVIWLCSWYTHILCGQLLRRKFTESWQTIKRIAISLLIYVPLTIFYNVVTFAIICNIPALGYQFDKADFLWASLAGFIINCIATGTFETIFLFSKWKHSLIETEEFKKAYVQSELDNLKSQVNPHFLFNSINSLSSLIIEEPKRAEAFLDEMGKVYRYLLQNNDQELTPLHLELDFLKSYFHLLQTRHEGSIFMEDHIPEHYLNYLLPPLTLQMLVENAVKHNILLEETPLLIRLSVNENDQLVVINNLQKKTLGIISNKIGLNNIKAKYHLLNQPEVYIEETPHHFMVAIPLIKSLSHEDLDS